MGRHVYTPEGVRAILDDWWGAGGENSGLYFRGARRLPLIRELTPSQRIVALVEDPIAEDELELAFVPLERYRQTPR